MKSQHPTLRKYETFRKQYRAKVILETLTFAGSALILWALAEATVYIYMQTH